MGAAAAAGRSREGHICEGVVSIEAHVGSGHRVKATRRRIAHVGAAQPTSGLPVRTRPAQQRAARAHPLGVRRDRRKHPTTLHPQPVRVPLPPRGASSSANARNTLATVLHAV